MVSQGNEVADVEARKSSDATSNNTAIKLKTHLRQIFFNETKNKLKDNKTYDSFELFK